MGGYTAKGKGLPLAGCLRIAANSQIGELKHHCITCAMPARWNRKQK